MRSESLLVNRASWVLPPPGARWRFNDTKLCTIAAAAGGQTSISLALTMQMQRNFGSCRLLPPCPPLALKQHPYTAQPKIVSAKGVGFNGFYISIFYFCLSIFVCVALWLCAPCGRGKRLLRLAGHVLFSQDRAIYLYTHTHTHLYLCVLVIFVAFLGVKSVSHLLQSSQLNWNEVMRPWHSVPNALP